VKDIHAVTGYWLRTRRDLQSLTWSVIETAR